MNMTQHHSTPCHQAVNELDKNWPSEDATPLFDLSEAASRPYDTAE